MSIEAAFFGTLAADAEQKVSKSGKPYLRFRIRTGDGDAALWVGVMLFGEDVAELAPKLLKGSRAYIEGSIRVDEWTAQDGSKRHGLSVMSRHCRLAAIGRNRPKRERESKAPAQGLDGEAAANNFHDDPIGF